MKQIFTASIWLEGKWFVAQCLEVYVASQGKSKAEALKLHFELPQATIVPQLQKIEVEVKAA